MSSEVDEMFWLGNRLHREDQAWPGPPWPLLRWDDAAAAWENVGLPLYKVVHVSADYAIPSAPILVVVEISSATITLPAAVSRYEGLQVIVKTKQSVYDTVVQPPAGTLIDSFRASRRLLPLRTMTYLAASGSWWETADLRMSE